MKVFLGGTCGNSTWREELLKDLNGEVEAFNPVVPDWTPECQAIEDEHKAKDDILLFVITPETKSPYSISEITRSAITDPARTMVCVVPVANGAEFEPHEAKAWVKILKDIKKDGAIVCETLEEVAKTLNEMALTKPQKGE